MSTPTGDTQVMHSEFERRLMERDASGRPLWDRKYEEHRRAEDDRLFQEWTARFHPR